MHILTAIVALAMLMSIAIYPAGDVIAGPCDNNPGACKEGR